MVTDQLPPLLESSPHGVKSDSYRPDVMGIHGAVVANHPLAAQAGMSTLQKGGNAVDAALAIGFALGAAEPQSSGLGGDGFIMIYMKDGARVEVANGTGAAPLAATRERYREGIPAKGPLSISVPGIVHALLSAHDRFGRLKLAECLEPAIELCEDGVPTSHRIARLLESEQPLLDYESTKAVFAPTGRLARAGEVVRNPDLARTIRMISDGGADLFYKGPIAEEIVRHTSELGGILTIEDFARHETRWQEPISTTYRGHTVYEGPPNSSGHVLLQELNIAELYDIPSWGPTSPETIHVMVEAKRLAFADREAYLADPEHVDVPIEGLICKDYARARARLIDLEAAAKAGSVREGDPWGFQDAGPDPEKRFRRQFRSVTEKTSGTTHFCVIDRWGNAVSELQSLQTNFGSAVIAGSTGILMNNRMTYWHLDEGHIDALHPGQRVRHTMNPVMAFSDSGDLRLVCGTPGGDTQVQTNAQMLVNAIDFGYTASECVEAPRWTHYQDGMESTYPHTTPERLRIERRMGDEAVSGLKERGHNVEVIGAWEGIGSAGMIQVNPDTGALMAAADPRRDGQALAW
ncbi:MAG: gamma-glutamyltransferase [Chloroflexi bacterium]|nr:gamma-glutamyltransferase [Chloroflexota bacterium]